MQIYECRFLQHIAFPVLLAVCRKTLQVISLIWTLLKRGPKVTTNSWECLLKY